MTETVSTHFSENARRWLELLLQDRLAPAVELRALGTGEYVLALSGQPQGIRFSRPDPALRGQGGEVGCSYWDCTQEGFRAPVGLSLPAPGGVALPPQVVTSSAAGVHVAYDVLGLVYWALTRQEELTSDASDRHGRFPASASHAHRYGYLDRPLVDEWLMVLGAIARRLWPRLELVQREYTVFTSHDVDFPSRYGLCTLRHFARSIAQDVLVDRRPLAALNGVRIRLTAGSRRLANRDPHNTFDWLMEQSEAAGIRSTFFFICGGRTRLDPGYEPGDRAIKQLMLSIRSRGHAIGLHPSYGCMESADMLPRQADALRRVLDELEIGQPEIGARMHFLRWRWPRVLHLMERARMAYDATLGYADRTGFRAGTAIPFRAFDPLEDRISPVVMRPLVVMEGTVQGADYMGLTNPQAQVEHIDHLKERCRAVNGVFSILWHNSELRSADARSTYTHAIAAQP